MNRKVVEKTMTADQNKPTQEEEFGWKFHRFPLIVSIVLTALFYIAIFIYVAME